MSLPARAAGERRRPCASGRPQPGQTAGAGSNGKPFSTQGRAAAPCGAGTVAPPPAGPGRRSRKQWKALCPAKPGPPPRVGLGLWLLRPPGPAAGAGSGGKPFPRGAGPPSPPAGPGWRSRKRREAFPARGRGHRLCRVGASPAARRGRCPRDWDCRPSPAGPPPTGLGLPPFVNRGRLPEPEAAGSPSHARPGRRPCRVSASPVARRATAHGVGTAALRQPGQTAGAGSGGKPHPPSAGVVAHGVGTAARRPPGPSPAWGWDCRPSPAGPDCRRRKRREASPTQSRGRRPRGVGTAALRQPGQTAGAGSGGKPLPRKAGLSPV